MDAGGVLALSTELLHKLASKTSCLKVILFPLLIITLNIHYEWQIFGLVLLLLVPSKTCDSLQFLRYIITRYRL